MPHLRIRFVRPCTHAFAGSAQAQTYPAKPVTIVVTLAAGGAADVIARAIAQRLTEEWGQPVVVENKGGANNQVGTASVARAAADGYTLLLTPEHTFTVNPFLYRRLSYDAVKDFTPITGVVTISQALAVHPSLPAKTTAELVALAKGKPGELNYGGLGAGSGPHLSMELLQDPMMFVSTGLVVQPWKAGQLRLLGVGAGERLAQLPDLPTIAESLPGFTAVVWFGLFAPTGTPREIVTKINNAVQRILADPGFRDKFLTPNFYEPVSGSPEQFAEHIRSDAQRWQKVIRDAKIAAEE